MPNLTFSTRRLLALAGIALSVAVLIPGLVLPVIYLDGTLEPEGVRALAPRLIEQGLTDETVDQLRPLLHPALVPVLEGMPGGLRAGLANELGRQLGGALAEGQEITVYTQVRSILGSVRHLYRVGSVTAASLILLFSVLVPFTKAALVCWAVLQRDRARRAGTLRFVEGIAKWSMADVFAVALFIAYLAAQATQTTPAAGTAVQVVSFDARFGPGFYWFAGYCLLSLATQQATARWLIGEPGPGG